MAAGDEHFVAFDYLADAVDEAAPIRQVPAHAWDAVTAFVPAADLIEVAWSAFLRHRLDIAERALSRAVAAGHHEAAIEFAVMMGDSGRFEDMVVWLEQAVEAATAAGASPEEIIQLRDQTAFWLGAHHHGHGDPGRAHSLGLAIVTDSTRLVGADHPQTLQSRATLIRQIGELGDPEEALNMAQELAADTGRLHGTNHRMHYKARFEVAVWTRFSGDPRRAVRLSQDLIDDSLTTGTADIKSSLRNLASALDHIGDPELDTELAVWLESLIDRTLQQGRTDDKIVVLLFGTLAWWVGGRGDGDGDGLRARDIAQWTVETGGDLLGPDDADVLWARIILAHQEGRLGSTGTARTLSSEALEAATRIYGDLHFVTRQARIAVDRWAAPDHPEQTPRQAQAPQEHQ